MCSLFDIGLNTYCCLLGYSSFRFPMTSRHRAKWQVQLPLVTLATLISARSGALFGSETLLNVTDSILETEALSVRSPCFIFVALAQ